MRLVDSEAHARAASRMLANRGHVFDAFDGMLCGFDHEDALEYLAGSPSFQALQDDRKGLVVGIVLGFAMTAIESDRDQR